jgi:WXG100 family type VII secretion target
MANKIEVNYEDLEALSKRFSLNYDRWHQFTQLLKIRVNHVYATWDGKGAGMFEHEMENLVYPAVQRFAHALHAGQDTCKKIGQKFQDSEEEAGNLFKAADGADYTVMIGYIDNPVGWGDTQFKSGIPGSSINEGGGSSGGGKGAAGGSAGTATDADAAENDVPTSAGANPNSVGDNFGSVSHTDAALNAELPVSPFGPGGDLGAYFEDLAPADQAAMRKAGEDMAAEMHAINRAMADADESSSAAFAEYLTERLTNSMENNPEPPTISPDDGDGGK